jgi:outer membrane protein assembly complex protein YaeT
MVVVPASPPLQEILERCQVARVGDRLDEASLERTSALLKASGLFTGVTYTVDGGEAAEVSWTLVPRSTVSRIRISGNLWVLSSMLLEELPARTGDLFDDGLPGRFRDALLATYRAQGFPDASVTAEAVPTPPFGFAINLSVHEGKPRVIRSVRFAGDAPFTDEELSVAAGLVLGSFWTEKSGESLRSSLLEFLRDRGYIEAACTVFTEPHEGAFVPPLDFTRPFLTIAGFLPGAYPGVRVVAEIATGLPWKTSLSGVPPGLEEKIAGALTFMASGTVDAYERERSKSEVRRRLQEEGYFEATTQIAFAWVPSPSIAVTVAAGPPSVGYDIVYSGVPVEPLPSLREAVGTITTDYPQLTDELLGRIRESVRSSLASQGYPNATVPEPIVSRQDEKGRWRATVTVDPGERLTLGPLAVEGVTILPPQELLDLLEWQTGAPFDAARINAGRERLVTIFMSRGHLTATVELTLEEHGGVVAGRCVAHEGPVYTNGSFAVIGNSSTSAPFVLRLAGLEEGVPVSPSAITKAQLSLYRTGLFSRVSIIPASARESGAPIDYLIRVEETAPRRLNVAAGYGDRDGWRGMASLRHFSLLGQGEEGYLSAKVSQKNQEYGLGIRLPYLPNGWSLELSGYRQRRERPSFTEEATGGRISVGKAFTPALSLSVACRLEGYDYPVFTERFVPLTGSAVPGTMIGIPITLRYDDRDNPFLPTVGSLFEMVTEYSPDVFDTGDAFTRVEGSAASFLTPTRSLTIGLSLRAGTIIPANGDGEVPLRERYFLGGGTSVRGFVPDSLGPKDGQGFPLGGRSLIAGSIELRFPLSRKLQGAFFVDAGGVFLDQRIDWGEVKESVGVGARYLTPIGPVRLDLAWRLDPKAGEEMFRAHFTLGYPF